MRDNFKEKLKAKKYIKEESTGEKYERDIKYVEKWFGKSIDSWDKKDFEDFVQLLGMRVTPKNYMSSEHEPKYSASTVRGYLFAVKAYLRAFNEYVKLNEWFDKPMRDFRPIEKKRDTPVIIDTAAFLEDVKMMKLSNDSFEDIQGKFIIYFNYFLNTRVSELVEALLSEISKKRQEVVIFVTKGGEKKLNHQLVTSELFWDIYDEYLIEREKINSKYLFCDKDGNKYTISQMQYRIRKFNVVLREYLIEGVTMSAHLGRRSRLTKLAGRVSSKKLKYTSRHKNIISLEPYVKASEEEQMVKEMREDDSLRV
jgi:site-specific recombinase XerC